MINNRITIYWTIQILAWGGFTVFLTAMMNVYAEEPLPLKAQLLQVVIGASCLISSHIFRMVIKRYNWVEFPLRRLLPMILVGALGTAILAQTIIHLTMLTVMNWQSYKPIDWAEFPVYVANVFVPFLGWSVFYFAYHYFERARKSKLDALRAEAAVKEAELIALKSQINPHFLFNSLNNIKALILENPMKARDAISNLSDLLRYSVKFSNQTSVNLESEIEIVENYLQLESFQYDNRLSFSLEIDQQTLDKKIPPMIVQLLVENAVKHGISQLPEGGSIRISTRLKEDKLIIEVVNSGSIKDNRVDGIGIQNALDRIRLLYDIEPSFELRQVEGSVMASLQLPILL